MPKAKDEVAAFLHRRTFFCKHLNANLTPEECCDRQKRKVEEQRYGRKFLLNNDPQSRYCREGDANGRCKQGKEQRVKLRLRRKRAREKRAALRA